MADSYAVSIHWALTQFTPATNNVAPVTVAERPFFFFHFSSSLNDGLITREQAANRRLTVPRTANGLVLSSVLRRN